MSENTSWIDNVLLEKKIIVSKDTFRELAGTNYQVTHCFQTGHKKYILEIEELPNYKELLKEEKIYRHKALKNRKKRAKVEKEIIDKLPLNIQPSLFE